MLIDAAKAAIPAGLLAMLQSQMVQGQRQTSVSRAGKERRSPRGGRPAGSRSGDPRRGGRLDLVATLRTAAPWQTVRQRERSAHSGVAGAGLADAIGSQLGAVRRIEVRRSDFAIRRFKEKTGTVLIFAVDASGSAAVARLAEAKGAVELLLADCYARRDEVAVLSFRGKTAELLLPPTRALARAKRALSDLPGGGGTPLAAALDAARELATGARRRGREPAIVLLTDGRGNVARDGATGRAAGEADALLAARALRELNVGMLVIDTSARPQVQAGQLAQALLARYVALPYADARKLSVVVRAELSES
jgi:magnesium chelatase subunit D